MYFTSMCGIWHLAIVLLVLIIFVHMSVIEQHKSAIQQLCAMHKVKRLYVFGSVLTNNFHDSSDVDMLVAFEAMDVANYADNYFDLKFSLQNIFKRHVDLLEEKALKNPYFISEITRHRKLVYEH